MSLCIDSYLCEKFAVPNNYLTRKEQLILLFVAASAVIGGIVLYVYQDEPDPETSNTSPATDTPLPRGPTPERASQPEPEIVLPALAHSVPAVTQERVPIRVAVRGAVYAPDLYSFEPDEDPRVQDLLDAAGGLEDYADASDINLAARLIDGTTLTVPGQPSQGEATGIIRASREAAPPPLNPPQYTVSGWRPEAAPSRPFLSDAAPGAASAPVTFSDGLLDLNTATQAEREKLPGIGPVFASRIIEYRTRTPFRTVEELMNIKGIAEKRLADVRHLVTVR